MWCRLLAVSSIMIAAFGRLRIVAVSIETKPLARLSSHHNPPRPPPSIKRSRMRSVSIAAGNLTLPSSFGAASRSVGRSMPLPVLFKTETLDSSIDDRRSCTVLGSKSIPAEGGIQQVLLKVELITVRPMTEMTLMELRVWSSDTTSLMRMLRQ